MGESCIAACVSLFKAEVNLHQVEVVQYSRLPRLKMPGSYIETQGPIDGPGAGKTLCSRTLMDRSSK
jgi:hypothetical protein